MNNKAGAQKSGIKIMYAKQPQVHKKQVQVQKRDSSPNPHRKKIFQKIPVYANFDNQYHQPKITQINMDSPSKKQYQLLVQNLKKKSMQLQLRDNLIQNLNKQLEDLKKQIKQKDRQIAKLKTQIQDLDKNSFFNQKHSDAFDFNKSSESFDINKQATFKSKVQTYSPFAIEKPLNYSPSFTGGDLSIININKSPYENSRKSQKNQQVQILSPFMALSNNRERVSKSDVFDNQILRQSSSKVKQLQKFNIFNQKQQSPLKNEFSIEHSKQFNFQQLQKSDFKGFGGGSFN